MPTTLLDEFAGLLAAAGLDVEPKAAPPTAADALFVIDMQHDFLPGGAFGVAEGNSTVPAIAGHIQSFAAAGAKVFATRDYHPIDHCSFASHGGPFPAHCVQGTKGAELVPGVAEALQPLVAEGKASIVFKAFSKDVDSFGAFPYDEAAVGGRVSAAQHGKYCGVGWTGASVLFSSNAKVDVNAPPDVMAVLDRTPLSAALPVNPEGRVVVVGLALDFCVLDTALNAAKLGHKVTIVLDATRAAHIPGVGSFGSGFLSDPAAVTKQLKDAGITVTSTL